MTARPVRPAPEDGGLKGQWSLLDDMSAREAHDLFKLRQDVFVVEQDCAYGDIDGKDFEALHFLLRDPRSGQLAGALRVFLPQAEGEPARIGRVVLHPDYRGGGRGRDLMRSGLQKVTEEAPQAPVCLSAQAHLEQFYAEFGFQRCSENYLEDGIWHVDMFLNR